MLNQRTRKTGLFLHAGILVWACLPGRLAVEVFGEDWHPMDSGTRSVLRAVWGSGPNDVFAVGENGVILHYDGWTWSVMNGATLLIDLLGVWGSGPNDVYAVGESGTILHYNGTRASLVASGTTTDLMNIWGSGPNDVYVVGRDGSILHWNGSTGVIVPSGATQLSGVWGSSATDVYVVGSLGSILHWNGSAAAVVPSGTIEFLTAIWGSSSTDVYVVGLNGMILHWNGSSGAVVPAMTAHHLWAVWGSGPSDVYAVGDVGTILHWDDFSASVADYGADVYFRGLWGSGPRDVFAVGDAGVIYHFGDFSLSTSVVSGLGTLTPPTGPQAGGTAVQLVAAPNPHWRVKSWTGTDDDVSTANTNSVTMTAGKRVTVEFEAITHSLTTGVVNGHGTLVPSSGSQNEGTTVALTATPDSGYRVKAWTGTDDDTLKTNANAVTMTADKSVLVEFEPIPHSLTTEVAGGHGTLVPASGSHSEGDVVALTATPDSGYRVKAWIGTDNDTLKTNTNAVTMTADKSVTVEFEQGTPLQYQLTTSVIGGHGSLVPAPGPQTTGTQVQLTSTPDSGYRVKAWIGTANDASKDVVNTVTITGDTTVTVQFEIGDAITHLLTTSVVNGHGTLSPASGQHAEGGVVVLKATPDSGYHVVRWTGTNDDASADVTNAVTMTGDKAVTVEFAKLGGPCMCAAAAPLPFALFIAMRGLFRSRPRRL